MPGVEPGPRPSQSRVLIHYTSQTNSQWCRRDSNPQSLVSKTSRSAVGVPHRIIQATHTGFEPVLSAVTGQRPLQAGPMGRKRSNCERAVCSTQLVNSLAPLKADARCLSSSSPGRTRTVDRLDVSQLPSPLGHRTINLIPSGRPGTRTPKRGSASCFQDTALIQPDVFLAVCVAK